LPSVETLMPRLSYAEVAARRTRRSPNCSSLPTPCVSAVRERHKALHNAAGNALPRSPQRPGE
jgi:hypothetical protein